MKIKSVNRWQKFLTSFTWRVKNTSTADLFHIVGNIEMVTTSQDSYSCPSSKVIDFAVNNFWFLGILQSI